MKKSKHRSSLVIGCLLLSGIWLASAQLPETILRNLKETVMRLLKIEKSQQKVEN